MYKMNKGDNMTREAKATVKSLFFTDNQDTIAEILDSIGAATFDEIDEEKLYAYLKENFDEPEHADEVKRSYEDIESGRFGQVIDKVEATEEKAESGYLLTVDYGYEFFGLSHYVRGKPLPKIEQRIDRQALDNVGNTNGRDIKCRSCKEPWENAGIVSDFTQEELNEFVVLGAQSDDEYGEKTRIVALNGCPGCATD